MLSHYVSNGISADGKPLGSQHGPSGTILTKVMQCHSNQYNRVVFSEESVDQQYQMLPINPIESGHRSKARNISLWTRNNAVSVL